MSGFESFIRVFAGGFESWETLLAYLRGPSPDREVRHVWYHARSTFGRGSAAW